MMLAQLASAPVAIGPLSPVEISALVAVALFLALGAGLFLWLRARRRQVSEVRGLIEAIESVRDGEGYLPAVQAPGSPLALVGDALNRLGADVTERWSDAEASGERLRAVMDAAEDTAVVTTDLDGDVITFSRGATTLFGWHEDEVVGRPAAILFQGDAYKDFLPKLTRRSLREQGITARSTLVRRDGSSFPGNLSVRALKGESQRPGFLMVVKDITEQARLEADLRASEERYRGLVDGLSEGVAIVREGKLVFANGAFGRLCKRPPEVLVGKGLHELVATRDVLMVEDSVAVVEREGDRRDAEQEFRANLVDDSGLPLAQIAVKASRIEYGGQPAVLLLARDETVERRIETELRHNEARLDAVIEAMSDGLLVLSSDASGGTVLMTNRAFANLFGTDVKTILGRSLPELQATLAGLDSGAAAVAELLGQGKDAPSGMTVRVGAKRERELEVRLASLTDRSGSGLGRVLACRDMTARRQSESELQSFAERLQLSKTELESACGRLETMNRQLNGRAEELDRLNTELQALNEMKTHLLGNVAHELQTPLVSVRGYTEMILKGRLGAITEEQRKGLTLALKNIDRLISMIDNLLSFSRAQSDIGALTLERFELPPLVRETRDLLRQQMTARGIDYRENLELGGRQVYADRGKIAQVMTNLLSNAIKFNEHGGSVGVSATCSDEAYLLVRVTDSGPGIPGGQLERIFERNYRVDSPDRPAAPGSGIGLAIVRDILRQHGCRIYAESVVGEGTTFSFTLPLAPRDSGRRDHEGSESEEQHIVARPDKNQTRGIDVQVEPMSSTDEAAPKPRPRLRIIRNRKP